MSKFIKIITSSEDVKLKDKILKFINQVGEYAFGGNCGMFAISLAEILQKYNKDCNIVFCTNRDDEFEDEQDPIQYFLYGEPDMYHVAIEIDGILYDGSGIINNNYLKNFVKEEYGRDYVCIDKLDYSSNKDNINKSVRYNTAYSNNPEAYIKEWDKLFKENK